MVEFADFISVLGDAYEHLYDLVYLRTHRLATLLVRQDTGNKREIVWELHHLLLDVIQELDPGPQAPITSREWRRHRLMALRYTDGLTPQAVADQLAISRRHYYRELEAALDAIATILWERYIVNPKQTPHQYSIVEDTELNRLELLRLEAARAAQSNRYTGLPSMVDGILALLHEQIQQRALIPNVDLRDPLPNIAVDSQLLRQMILAAVGYMIEVAARDSLRIIAYPSGQKVRLELGVQQLSIASVENARLRLNSFKELAQLGSVETDIPEGDDLPLEFHLYLPIEPQPTILIVDDNQDTLLLIQRTLSAHNYAVITASTAKAALEIAPQLQPMAITIDLMMPDMDGWDLMQAFNNHPNTRAIPIIVCSVLRQKELALSLGAAAFLEKPISEEELLGLLGNFKERTPA